MSCKISYIEKLKKYDKYIEENKKIPNQLHNTLWEMSQLGYNSLYSRWIKSDSKGKDLKILKETQRCIGHIISHLQILKENI